MIDTLFFDGDQTLWDFDGLMRRTLANTLAELRRIHPGPATDGLEVATLVADRRAVARELPETNLERLRLAAFARTLSRFGHPDPTLAEHLNTYYLERRFSEVDLYPDTLPTLELLAKTYRLGLLSNGNSYPGRAGLADLFDLTVFAQDHGAAKPDPRLYAVAADGRSPTQLAMIGDSLTNDVTAAQACGWRGIWLNRDATRCPPSHQPDATITSLADLPDVLAAWVADSGGSDPRQG